MILIIMNSYAYLIAGAYLDLQFRSDPDNHSIIMAELHQIPKNGQHLNIMESYFLRHTCHMVFLLCII